jgi:XRE family transcriptional regulator, regulator of sulfur utilization
VTIESSTSAARRAFADAVRAAREETGQTPDSFATHVGLSPSTYEAIERGELDPPLDAIVQIAAALGLSAAELLARAAL